MAERSSLCADVRRAIGDTYYRLRPAQAGKNRGLAYWLLKGGRHG